MSDISKKKAGIIGAGGFTGKELLFLIAKHKYFEISYATSNEYAGKKISDVFPEIKTKTYDNLKFLNHPEDITKVPELDVIFLAVPDETSVKFTPLLLKRGFKVIDLSGAWRIQDEEIFKKYYGIERNDPETLKKAIFGLTEINREKIKGANLIANPGCYPTAALLPFYVIKDYLNSFDNQIFIDAKSGTSGAGGRKEKDTLAFSTVYENFRAYKTDGHQHEPEINQELMPFLKGAQVTFTPYLLPVFRGILSTSYLKVNSDIDEEKLKQKIKQIIENEPFIRFYESPNEINLKNVQNTNFLDFSFLYNKRKNTFIIFSAIDNLLKGAAGQAVQNLNVIFNFSETEGLL
ncbi:MAG: N-acetyl-gamma-glutamyl-phosphate reductase [Spirochaetia bacterium]|nr:N-acetyl-gamma-glutamyl-phosphate reductase [Spirochaetia bacterium]